jgi:tetratricopeptide (TPR) repeat protein
VAYERWKCDAVGCALVLFCAVLPALGQPAATVPKTQPANAALADPLTQAALERFYNLDYDTALRDFEKVAARHPDDPFAVNHLLTGVLMRELYRMGAMNTGEYANDSFIGQIHHPADPKVKDRIKDLVRRAEWLEERQLSTNPNNVDALYARGVTRAQFALYTALVERAWYSALRNAVGARHDHERVLELAPGYTDAKLVVGSHQYVTGSLPWAVKVAASVMGLSGSKEKGLQYLQEVANSNGEASIDARVVLMVFLRREHRYGEAMRLAHPLVARYPQNVLFALEEGNLLRASGRVGEAIDTYRRIWQAGKEGKYPGQHYEMAALSLGDCLRLQHDYSGSASAYEGVRQAPQADPELVQKADLGAGEMYDMQKRRDLAIQKYQAVIAANSGSPPADLARKHLAEPYSAD